MKTRTISCFIAAVFFSFLTFSPLHAQKHNASSGHKPAKKNANILARIPAPVTSSGSVTIDGQSINYKAVTGTLGLLGKKEIDTTAKMSFVAYFKKGVKNTDNRPITFLYNGGPGSSTVWLHMGSFGPKRVVVDVHDTKKAPYKITNNQYSLLDASDLVFVDAPGTGFGRIKKKHGKEYYGVDQDARAFAQFIMRFISRYGRWNSPKFLFGESYGTTRSAVLSYDLHRSYNIDLNGVILLSQILNFDLSIDGPSRNPGNDLPYQLGLPTYAASAWYHHKLPHQPDDLKAFLKKVEDFAMGEYALALAQGNSIDEATFNQIAEKLHNYTGLPIAYIKKADLRIDGGEFEQKLLNKEGKATGRLDTRFSGPVLDPLAQRSYYDPQSAAISGTYIGLFHKYVVHKLHYGKSFYYRPSVYGRMHWDWKHHGRGQGVNVMPDLARAMKTNPKMQVMLNAGYYDLATPFYEGVYELHHLKIPKNLQNNIHYAFYQSGHMVYVHVPALKKLHANVKAFIEGNYKKL